MRLAAVLVFAAACKGSLDGTYTMQHTYGGDPAPDFQPRNPVTLVIAADETVVTEDGTEATGVASDGNGGLDFDVFEDWGAQGGVPIGANVSYHATLGGDGRPEATGTTEIIWDTGTSGDELHFTVWLKPQ